MSFKKVPLVEVDKHGDKVFDFCSNALDADWIRAERLYKRAAKGDKEAIAKIRQLENEEMGYDTEFD